MEIPDLSDGYLGFREPSVEGYGDDRETEMIYMSKTTKNKNQIPKTNIK